MTPKPQGNLGLSFFKGNHRQHKTRHGMAVATELRTLGLKGVWGRCPQPGVPPLHPVLTSLAMAIQTLEVLTHHAL